MLLILGFFGVVIGCWALVSLFRGLKSSVIIREVSGRITKELLGRMAAAKVGADQFDCMEVHVGSLFIKAPYEVERAMNLSYAGLEFKRKNGGKVYLGEYKQQKKLAKRLISSLGLADYVCVRKTGVYQDKSRYTGTIKDTGSGVEVTASPTFDRVDSVIICRKDRVDEFAPKKVKSYHL